MEVNIKLSLLANQKQTPQGITGETPERADMTMLAWLNKGQTKGKLRQEENEAEASHERQGKIREVKWKTPQDAHDQGNKFT